MNLEIIKIALDAVVSLGIIVLGIPFIWGQFKKGKLDYAKENNDLLAGLVTTQAAKIKNLEDTVTEQGKQIEYLRGMVETLQKRKTDLESLIASALEEYFVSHPEIALTLQKQNLKESENV